MKKERKMFKDISIIKRVGLLSLFSIIGTTIVLMVGLNNLGNMNDNFNRVIDEDAKKVSLSKDIKANIIEMHRIEKNIILALTQTEMDKHRENFDSVKLQVDDRRLELRELVDDDNKNKLDNFRVNYEKYVKIFNEIANLTRLNSNAKAKVLLRNEARDKIVLVDKLTDELRIEILKDFKLKTTNTNYKNKLRALELIASIESNILKSVRDAGRAILLLEDNQIEEIADRSDRFLKLSLENSFELKKVANSNMNNKIDRMILAIQNYDKLQTNILRLTKQNTNQKAINLSTSTARILITEAMKNISDITKINEKVMQDAKIESDNRYDESINTLVFISVILSVIIIFLGVQIYKFLDKRLTNIYSKIEVIKSGDFIYDTDEVNTADELGQIATSINDTIKLLRSNSIENEKQSWITEGVNSLNLELIGETDIVKICNKSINYICTYLHSGIGSLYNYDEDTKTLTQLGSYAYVQREELSNIFKLGEGTVGQVALQRSPIQLKNIKRTQLVVDTGTTSEPPLNTYTFPLIYKEELFGVIEIGSSEIYDEKMSEFLVLANQIIATAIATAIQGEKVKDLLVQTEAVNTQMEEQQQQLEEVNSQMEEQQQQLEEANSQMEEQQQELKKANSQMEEQQQQLRVNTTILQEKNETLEKSQEELEKRAQDLELSNKYKSEFLANMSHELRTPLNSIILLSDMLHSNKSLRLDEGEVKKASIIYESGNELLRLINDVLDLSKIEAGQMELIVDTFDSTTLCETFQAQFEHTAKQKNLKLFVVDNYKGTIVNDKDRLSQVLRNLMSNSLKFTKEGSITLQIEETGDKQVKLSVIDTGIGISEQKTHSIFEAFQQAEGGTSREYGGTGLGLSISKELAGLMQGEILLESELGKGSTFSIVIPNLVEEIEVSVPTVKVINNQIKEPKQIVQNTKTVLVSDDRDNLTAVDSTFLIIEDDERFAARLREKINEKNENAVIALNGKEGLDLALEYNIKGVMLDLGLPDMDGIDVLKEFKTNVALRKIPVYIVSGLDKEKITKQYGTLGYTKKPITNDEIALAIDKINTFNDKKVKDLLIVEDNKNQRDALIEFLGNGTIKSKGVASISSAIKELQSGIYDGVIVDLGLEDGSGYEVCEYIYQNNLSIPIIIYTGSDLTVKEEKNLRKYTDAIIIKTANSQIRLLDEVDIFMHRVRVKTGVNNVNITDIDLTGKKILVVDDDIRNIYVLEEALESKGATVITANDGKEAIEVLNKNLDTSMVLMDIMMPIMNGYEATQLIKKDAKTKHIPVIAVTAKAMKEDKDKAIKAGCDDFITKPLKMDTLIGVVKGWLEKS